MGRGEKRGNGKRGSEGKGEKRGEGKRWEMKKGEKRGDGEKREKRGKKRGEGKRAEKRGERKRGERGGNLQKIVPSLPDMRLKLENVLFRDLQTFQFFAFF